jgi:hypothetical protein
MSPATATITRRAARAASQARPGASGAPVVRRPRLHLVPTRHGPKRARSAAHSARRLHVVAAAVVAAALVAVVIGQAILASGQVRLAALQHDLTLEQSANRQHQLTVAALETPARIVGAATTGLHMVRASGVTELPWVPLSVPLPTPQVIGAPPAPPTPTPATP